MKHFVVGAMTVAVAISLSLACAPGVRRPRAPETLLMPSSMMDQFKTECARLKAEKPGGVPFYAIGRNGWCYQLSELDFGKANPFFGAAAQTTFPQAKPEDADPLAAILDFKKQLEDRGIELIFVPIPVRPVIYPEGVVPLGKFATAEPLPHIKPMQDDFLRLVHQAGVDTIDLNAYFLANRHNEHGPLYCKSDTHWTPSGALFAAQTVASYLKTSRWYEKESARHSGDSKVFTTQWLAKEHFGHCYRALRDSGGIEDLPSEEISFRKIIGLDIDGEQGETLRHRKAPVVVIGDSNLIIWHDIHAAFSQELAFELGFQVDTLQTAGGGINQSRLDLAREIRKDSTYLESKKAVVWTFTARSEIHAKPGWVKISLEGEEQVKTQH